MSKVRLFDGTPTPDNFRGYCEICKKWVDYITLRQLKTKADIQCPECKTKEKLKL